MDVANLKVKINNKLGSYRKRDKRLMVSFPEVNHGLRTIRLRECIDMVKNLGSDRCPHCKCVMLFEYEPFCVHQFSFDRIDDKKIHTKENLTVTCWNCNSSGPNSVKNDCTNKCHTYWRRLPNDLIASIEMYR